MKSEHRHELEANSLAGFMNNLPQHLRTHSNKIFLVIAAALLVFAGLRYRENQRLVADQETRNALATAWDAVGQLRNQQIAILRGRPEEAAKTRNELIDVGNRSVEQVLNDSDRSRDATRMASAWQARGELFWTLSTLPPITEATTRPELAPPQDTTQALEIAANAYRKILSDFPNQVQPATAARFGLAAVAETRGEFDLAQEQYKAIIEGEKSAPTDKALAEQRIAKLDELRRPLLLLPATRPATQPVSAENRPVSPNFSNLSLGLGQDIPLPATQPATRPTTGPAPAQTTRPSTQPR